MNEVKEKVDQINIVNEVKDSFLEYSMSVIVSRALPDLRDGLKPVHRRILYSMFASGYTPDKQHRKCARIVGDVMGKYHPHGDTSIYDSMVRMAQDFSYRYPLVDGHGNFGNMDGDGAAAMRYTEAKMSRIALELLRDINKNTVDFVPNFDETEKEPIVLPSRYPNILVNGTMGIAVGMATNIPPHNLGEVIDGCIAYIDNRDITIDEIMEYVKGPDFPTGAKILGNSGIKKAYETGRGSITLRAKASIEQQNDRDQIIITEVPYNVNTLDLKKKIGELVRDKVIEGISDLHEETNLENGLKIVITLKKDANANVVLNNLYKHTQLQSNFGIILLMLDQGEPKTLNIKEIISKYVEYQKEIIIRRTKFDLEKAENRFHILEGLKIALDNIDEVIATIKKSKADGEAKTNLISKFGLSELQAEAILEMKLRRLTGLEREKIDEELKELTKLIESLKALLASEEQIYNTIKEELTEIKNKYSDDRRTEIDMTAIEFIEDESLIPEENIVVMLTREGYVKRVNPDDFKVQNRGGVGIKGMTTNEDDNVEEIIYLSTHDHLLFFSNRGKVYRLKGYEVPLYSRQAKGIPIVNLLQIEKEEVITSLIKIPQENTKPYLLFVTEKGVVKKTEVSEFESIRQTGKIAITLREGDQLISVRNTTGSDMILLASNAGRMVKFSEEEVRSMGRTATGVRGINLEDSKCIGAAVVNDDDIILMLTEKGYGKRNRVEDFRQTRRGSKGVKALNITDKNGTIVYFRLLTNQEELIIITNEGITIRIPISQIPLLGRVTQGLRAINLRANQKVTTAVLVANDEVTDENEE